MARHGMACGPRMGPALVRDVIVQVGHCISHSGAEKQVMDDSSTFLQYLPVLVALTAILLTSLLCRWAIRQPKRAKGKG